MVPFRQRLTIYQGSTFRWHAVLKNGKPPVATDLTGYTARMQIRSEVEATNVLVSLTTENGGIALGGVDGTIDLLIDAATTATYTWESGVYDIEFIYPSGEVQRKIQGTVTVSPEVTR